MSEKNAIIGTIIGDVVGSIYESKNRNTPSVFDEWFPKVRECRFTDDSVLTIAVADAIMQTEKKKDDKHFERFFKESLIDNFHYHSRQRSCSFEYRFLDWLIRRETRPYNSKDNGSAMRVSPIAYTSKTMEDVLDMAKLSAQVTHNNHKAIKGAQAVAAAIFFARTGHGKEEIRRFIEERFYKLSFTLDEIRPIYKYDISCNNSIPQAIVAFLEASDFEEAINNAISLGGGTLASIAGSIAGAYYPIPEYLRDKVLTYLTSEQTDIVLQFEKQYVCHFPFCRRELLSETLYWNA